MEERYNFLVDELADEFVELDEFGNYVIKEEPSPTPEQKKGMWSDEEHN
jgi:hypothetical protein